MPTSQNSEPARGNGIDCGPLRAMMVDRQIRTFDVTDHAVIARFLDVPREKFLPAELVPFAYSDMSLKLPAEATGPARHLLVPAVLARLIQAAAIKPTDRVLDVASATGYSAAIVAGLAGEVVALEADATRAATVQANLTHLEGPAVQVVTGGLADGVTSAAPFDVILINGGVESHLDGLLQQLRTGGRLLAIVREPQAGGYSASHAIRFESQSGRISSQPIFDADAAVLPEFRKAADFVF